MQFSRCSLPTLLLLAACGSHSALKPAEVLDERTGMTVEELRKPIELTQSGENLPALGTHISFAYLGPVEWDRSGTPSYGLWVHVAPGNDWQFESIQRPGTVSLVLDDGSTVLRMIEPPALAHATYRPVAPWGQTAYFDADEALLKRMAQSHRLELEVRVGRGEPVRFGAAAAGRAALSRYVAQQGF